MPDWTTIYFLEDLTDLLEEVADCAEESGVASREQLWQPRYEIARARQTLKEQRKGHNRKECLH